MTVTPYLDSADLIADLRRLARLMVAPAQVVRGLASVEGGEAHAVPMQAGLEAMRRQVAIGWDAIDARCAATRAAGRFLPWLHLIALFGLGRVEQTFVLVALIARIDPGYALALATLAPDAGETDDGVTITSAYAVLGGSVARTIFDEAIDGSAPLIDWRIVLRLPDGGSSRRGGRYRLDPAVESFLLGSGIPQPGWGAPLPVLAKDDAGYGLSSLILDSAVAARCQAILRWFGADADTAGFLLHIQALDDGAAERLCTALFAEIGLRCVRLDGAAIAAEAQPVGVRVTSLCRDLLLSNSVVVLTNVQRLDNADAHDRLETVLTRLLASQRHVVVLNGPAARLIDIALGVTTHAIAPVLLTLPRPDAGLRRRMWDRSLAAGGLDVPPDTRARLATTYQLTESQILIAARDAASRHRLGEEIDTALVAACRQQAEREDLSVAREIRSEWRLDDVIVPPPTARALRDVLTHVQQRDHVMDDWGFGARLHEGRNLAILFHGASGTGKTMAASALANALGIGLYRIDLAAVLSKYIGETEQRLAQLFDQAEAMNVALFFDEAESLFGRRTDVQGANDRHANLQTGYLLQRIETYPGVVVLSTNLLASIDPAFIRRFRFIIDFPFPGLNERAALWRAAFPPPTPLADDIDYGLLAERAALTGGHIREAAITAAVEASAAGEPVTMARVIDAIAREYDKLGKVFSARDFLLTEAE